MTMHEQESIHELLRELRVKLESVQEPEERERLDGLIDDIEGRLQAHINEDHQAELIDELQDEVLSFEAEHPDAAATIRSLINMLTNLGL